MHRASSSSGKSGLAGLAPGAGAIQTVPMPFTLAHPAAVLPLVTLLQRRLGRGGVLSALIVGSMVPDIAFLLPIGVTRAQSHSFAGLLWCCLPLGLAGYLLFHWLLKAPLIDLLPHDSYSRLHPYARTDTAVSGRLLPVILLCIGVGALTHLAWDSFTHRDSMIVSSLPWLRLRLFSGGGFWVYVYTALQWICSLLGMGALALWGRRWVAATPQSAALPSSPLSVRQRWGVVVFVLGVAAVMAVMAVWPHLFGDGRRLSSQELVNITLLGWISGFGVGLAAWAIFWRMLPLRRHTKP